MAAAKLGVHQCSRFSSHFNLLAVDTENGNVETFKPISLFYSFQCFVIFLVFYLHLA